MNISWCTLSLMGSFICKGLELISIIPSLIQLSLQIKVNQMLQSEISVPCQLLTSPGAQQARQTLMPCIYLRLPHCNLNFCTCPRIPGKSVCVWGGHYWKAKVLYLYTCFVLSQLRFAFGVPSLPGALICDSFGFVKKGFCGLHHICYFHMLEFMQLGAAHLNVCVYFLLAGGT